MNISSCFEKIDRFLSKDFVQPLIVDFSDIVNLNALIEHYNVRGNTVINTSCYCSRDEYPHIDELMHTLLSKKERFFVTGFSEFLKLQGEKELHNTLRNFLSLSSQAHVVFITYNCKQYLEDLLDDPRIKSRILFVDGEKTIELRSIIFSTPELSLYFNRKTINGIDKIGDSFEKNPSDSLYVNTKKRKKDFPNSIYSINEITSAYDVLLEKDDNTHNLLKEYGDEEQWLYALKKFNMKNNWIKLVDSEFANHSTLDVVFSNFKSYDLNKQWLYFIAIKLFGANNNWVLDFASNKSKSIKEFIRQIYMSILNIPRDSQDFEAKYKEWKSTLKQLDNKSSEDLDFYCRFVDAKGKDALYYLTDRSDKEKELIFKFLDKYSDEYSEEWILSALKLVYPDLYLYLSDNYHFKEAFLSKYFKEYKYQKVINRVLPKFEEIVLDQALKRDYNRLLQPRTALIESIDREGAMLYFVDAMGAEYLSYIISLCSEFNLKAIVNICRCELPSITCKNKQFLEFFDDDKVKNIKEIDEIKHHGKDDSDYQKTKLPIHLISELAYIRKLLNAIKDELSSGKIKKAILISDHGASRLAVIHDTECIWSMNTKGEHSGRCCLKTEIDEKPEYATEAGEYWALANYDRFKGGRKADVEVHGGATLEEITVPIIELTNSLEKIDVHLLPVDYSASLSDKTTEITVSFRKKAAIKIFSTQKLDDAIIYINGKGYKATKVENDFYFFEMPDIKDAKKYSADLYDGVNCIASGLDFIVKKEGATERELF